MELKRHIAASLMENSPKQAVILCGGQGKRLRPLTDVIPKPLIDINGKPFLHYLICQLANEGITDFLLLTGYKKEKISEYFSGYLNKDINIEFSEGPVEWDTGRRIWEARHLINESFILMYSDNYCDFRLKEIIDVHEKYESPMTLTLAKKEKGNIRISDSLIVDEYNNDRKGKALNYVEIGYMALRLSAVLELFDNPDINFSQIISKMVDTKKVTAIIKNCEYYSISDPERLEIMREYLKKKKIILLDRDGTLNAKAPRGEYINSWKDFEWMPNVKDALKILASEGFTFIVISNQAGITRKMITENELKEITNNFEKELCDISVNILQTYICPHHWDDGCECRKPNPGLFFQASKDWLFRLDRVLYIGDDSRDCEAAYNAGCDSLFIGQKEELDGISRLSWPISINNDLMEALPIIRHHYKEI